MIRKIILFFVVVFVLTWIVIAHLAKSKFVSIINNSQTDNIRISYNDASVSGFPFGWTVRFASPKIAIIDQVVSREISSEYVNCVFNYNLSNAQLEFGKTLYYAADSGSDSVNYNMQSSDKIKVSTEFTKPLYKFNDTNSLRQVISKIKFANQSIIAVNKSAEELFSLSGVNLNFENVTVQNVENLSLKLVGDYKAFFSGHNVNNASLFLDINYIVNAENADFDRVVDIAKIKMNFDNAACDLSGSVSLSRNTLPKGKVAVELTHYDDLIDILLPDDFIFSKSYVKRIIVKAASIEFSTEISDKINFDINFSENGVALGKVNLFEMK